MSETKAKRLLTADELAMIRRSITTKQPSGWHVYFDCQALLDHIDVLEEKRIHAETLSNQERSWLEQLVRDEERTEADQRVIDAAERWSNTPWDDVAAGFDLNEAVVVRRHLRDKASSEPTVVESLDGGGPDVSTETSTGDHLRS